MAARSALLSEDDATVIGGPSLAVSNVIVGFLNPYVRFEFDVLSPLHDDVDTDDRIVQVPGCSRVPAVLSPKAMLMWSERL